MAIQTGQTLYRYPSSTFYTVYDVVNWYRNVPYVKKVHKTPLPYDTRYISGDFTQIKGSLKSSVTNGAPIGEGFNVFLNNGTTGPMASCRERLIIKAKGRFYDSFKADDASLGESLGEARSTLSMCSARLMQIYLAMRSLRRGDFVEFGKTLGILERVKKKHLRQPAWQVQRKASSLWLEYWWGWTPLIKEVYAVSEVMSNEFRSAHVSAGAKELISRSSYTNSVNWWGYDFTCRVRVGAEVAVSNPNLWLANQLGLVNPVSVAWELTPFSAVIDWFVGVGDYLNSLNENVGLSLKNSYYSYKVEGSFKWAYGTAWEQLSYTNGKAEGFRRFSGWPGSSVVLKPFRGFSTVRAATAAALVVSVFAPQSRTPNL